MQRGRLQREHVCAEDGRAGQTGELVTQLLEGCGTNKGLPRTRVQSPSAKRSSPVKSSTERLAWGGGW